MIQKGSTLIELIIGLAVGMIIMLALYGMVDMAQRTSTGVSRKVVTQQDARAVLDLMVKEIRMASFATNSATCIWRSYNPADNSCGPVNGPVAVPANKGIPLAYGNQLVVEMDINPPENPPDVLDTGDGKIDGNNELIYYVYDGNSNTISRAVGCNSAPQTILGGVGNETSVLNGSTNPVTPLFRYYDKDDNPITFNVLADQTKIKNIRSITITIVAETEQVDPNTKLRKRMYYSTNILVRNHVLNP